MSNNSFLVDPLGNINKDIKINNIKNYKQNKDTIDARLNDFNRKIKSSKYILTLWSIIAGIFILILLMLIRNINN